MPVPTRIAHPAAPESIRCCHAETPLGTVLLTGQNGQLTGLYFTGEQHSPQADPAWVWEDAPFADARRQLDEYFDGRRTDFDVPIALHGSPFELTVWTALQAIPFGTTASYGQIAGRIGRPGAARAVGAANGRNPVSIIVPCHRVIGADASLTGYGWGIERKAWLLDHERLDLGKPPDTLALNVPYSPQAARSRRSTI